LEISHEWNKTFNESIKEVYDLLDSSGQTMRFNERQSDRYDHKFETNRTGLAIRGRKEKFNYSIGVQSQPLVLSGTSMSKNYSTTYRNINWIPSARFVYNFSRNNALTATIEGSAREPGFLQLQPVTDSSNLENIIIGNSDLKNEFTNRYSVRYNRSNNKGSSLFFNLSYDKTQDKIVSSRMNNPTGTGRSTTYINTDGFYGYSGDASFTQPFSDRKYSVSVGLGANYDNNISYTDGYKNKGQNLNLRPSFNFRMDIDEVVDLTLRSSFSYYQTETRYETHTKSNTAQTLRLGLDGKNYFDDLTIGYNFTKSINYNFSQSLKDNPLILNLYAEYRFFKKKNLNLRMQAYDLFNKYTGLTRTINGTTITDSRSSRLGRLFLLSANVRLNKYGGGKAASRRSGDDAMPQIRD
jgi:outer membrane receptor protein involved in Fe transport